MWRRVSGGLTRTQQDEIFKRIAPHFVPSFAKKADRKPPGAQEAAEMWRCVASMERIAAKQKAELGDALLGRDREEEGDASRRCGRSVASARACRSTARVEGVVARAKAEKWLERAAGDGVEGRRARAGRGGAGARVGRSRARSRRRRCAGAGRAAARRVAEGERLARLVLEPTAREAREERLAFGDSLPSGLRLVSEPSSE